jgi:hypothetical protein
MHPPLTHLEQALLDEVVAHRHMGLRALRDDLLRGRRLTAVEANALRDAIGDELTETGIDAATGAVNQRGERLDDLIDRVAALSELHEP